MASPVALLLTSPGWRGSGTSFAKIAVGLQRYGHDVQLLVTDPAVQAQFHSLDIDATLLPGGAGSSPGKWRVRQLIRRHGARVLIADTPRDVRLARWATLVSDGAVVWRYNLHGRSLTSDLLQRWLIGGVARIVHSSQYSAQRLAADAPWLSAHRTSLIPNGFDVDALRPDQGRGAVFRQSLQIGSLPLVITPNALHPEKQVGVAFAAVQLLAATTPIAWAVTDTPERVAALGAPVPGLTVKPLGVLPSSSLHDAIRAADIVFQTSPLELFANVIAEAMALGRPVLAAASGGVPELVAKAGMLFTPGDSAHAARELMELLGDGIRREELGRAARERIVTRYPLSQMEQGYAELVERLG